MTAWPKVERTMSDIAHRADARNRVDDDFIDRDRLVLSHDRLIQKIVRQNQRSGKVPWSDDAFDDAVSSGNIAFLEAYPRYDPAAGHPVRTFAWKPVDGEVKRFGRENASIIKTPRGEDHLNVDSLSGPAFKGESDDGDTELVSTLSDSAPSAEKNILREEQVRLWKADLVRALRTLTRRECKIYFARELTAPPIPLETLAAEHGVSRERVRQIALAAVGKVEAQLRRLRRHVDKRPMMAPPQAPQLSWLQYEQRKQAYVDKGYSPEIAEALAGQREASTEATFGLPGSDDRHWRKSPQAIWRAPILRIPKAKPQPSFAKRILVRKRKWPVKFERQFPLGVMSFPIKVNPFRALIDAFLATHRCRQLITRDGCAIGFKYVVCA